MQRWGVTLGLCILILSAACGGNPTAPPNLPPATAALPTALPVEATRAPTLIPTTPITAQTATSTAAAATLPPPTVTSVPNLPSATTASNEPTRAPSATFTSAPTDTPTLPAPTQFHGDVAKGAALFEKMGCKGCHMPPPQARRIAPDLKHILADADEFIRLPEYKGTATDAPSYIRESIVLPNIFVVPAWRYLTMDGSSIMPLDFGQRLSAEEIDDLTAYILTLPQAK
ncbi:MAG: hypothetical protein HDKAJFGB_00755 [Anaerolineae bacterium]|nr:hypothetical protein [Anaerolineae bacterium]